MPHAVLRRGFHEAPNHPALKWGWVDRGLLTHFDRSRFVEGLFSGEVVGITEDTDTRFPMWRDSPRQEASIMEEAAIGPPSAPPSSQPLSASAYAASSAPPVSCSSRPSSQRTSRVVASSASRPSSQGTSRSGAGRESRGSKRPASSSEGRRRALPAAGGLRAELLRRERAAERDRLRGLDPGSGLPPPAPAWPEAWVREEGKRVIATPAPSAATVSDTARLEGSSRSRASSAPQLRTPLGSHTGSGRRSDTNGGRSGTESSAGDSSIYCPIIPHQVYTNKGYWPVPLEDGVRCGKRAPTLVAAIRH